MLSFPLSAKCFSIESQLNTLSFHSESSQTGVIKQFKTGISHYSFKLTFTHAPTITEISALEGFFLKVKSNTYNNTCLLPLPSQFDTKTTTTQAIPVRFNTNANTAQVQIKNLPVSTNNVLLAGDKIQFTNHHKLYVLLDNVNSDSNGYATINIEPPLVYNVALDEQMKYKNLTPKVRIINKTLDINYSPKLQKLPDLTFKEDLLF